MQQCNWYNKLEQPQAFYKEYSWKPFCSPVTWSLENEQYSTEVLKTFLALWYFVLICLD